MRVMTTNDNYKPQTIYHKPYTTNHAYHVPGIKCRALPSPYTQFKPLVFMYTYSRALTLVHLYSHTSQRTTYRQVLALMNMLASTPVTNLVDATVMEKRAATELEAVTLQTNDDWNAR